MLPLLVLSTGLHLDLGIDVLTVTRILENGILACEVLREELRRDGDDFLVLPHWRIRAKIDALKIEVNAPGGNTAFCLG